MICSLTDVSGAGPEWLQWFQTLITTPITNIYAVDT
jgi:hypothetical protein